ncbi:MAG: ATP-grasp fold amidoligase family protein [Deltaproteobacteria bacterium]
MTLIEKTKKIIKSPQWFLLQVIQKFNSLFTDKIYVKVVFWLQVGKKLNLNDTQTFNEKLQWLKLYDRRPEYTKMVDKYKVKKHVASLIGEEYIIPTLGVWNKFEEIDFEKLPNQFVLKTTHDSGGVILCKDKSLLDINAAKLLIDRLLKRNFFYITREWPYKNVTPRVIAEKYMVDESGIELKDYKIFNFNGKAKIIQVDFGRFTEHERNIYTSNWDFIDAQIQYPNNPKHQIDRPKQLEKMLELAAILSKDLPHVRTDFYSVEDQIFFGELTFHHGSGHEKFTPESLNNDLGKCILLPNGGRAWF